MIEYGYTVLRHFPKAERHVLSQEIRLSMWNVLRLVITVGKRYHKKTTLRDLDAELALLQYQVRIAHQLRFLALRQYENWSNYLIEMGRMIGGMIKTQNASQAKQG